MELLILSLVGIGLYLLNPDVKSWVDGYIKPTGGKKKNDNNSTINDCVVNIPNDVKSTTTAFPSFHLDSYLLQNWNNEDVKKLKVVYNWASQPGDTWWDSSDGKAENDFKKFHLRTVKEILERQGVDTNIWNQIGLGAIGYVQIGIGVALVASGVGIPVGVGFFVSGLTTDIKQATDLFKKKELIQEAVEYFGTPSNLYVYLNPCKK